MKNLILMADSYKYSMWNQYPPGTEYVYSYIESRGGRYSETVFFGLQAFLKDYLLLNKITKEMVDEAEELITLHGEPFYREGWDYIVNELDGLLPLCIKAVPEGSVVNTNNILVSIVNTDPKCWWLTTVLETALLRAIWYPTTVATNSREIKKVIKEYLVKTGDIAGLPYKLHDFGSRGASSHETAALGGCAHLINFMGTDNVEALQYARKNFNCDMAGFSIPAMEHSTVTSWGRDHEVAAYRNMLRQHAKPGGLVACVSDSYDIFAACEKWGTELKKDVLDSGATIVIRPDSGDPATVVLECLKILDKHFGSTFNSKGFKVLNNIRVLQGDGVNIDSVKEILQAITTERFSADNIAFGMGGALLQGVTRDDQKFAMKCSAICVDGKWRDVYKDPVTDPGKTSKKGILKLVEQQTVSDARWKTTHETVRVADPFQEYTDDILDIVYEDGIVYAFDTFEKIRNRAEIN